MRASLAVALCGLALAISASADSGVDRVTRQLRCGPALASVCTSVSQAVRDAQMGLSISYTEMLSSETGEVLFLRQQLLVGKASPPSHSTALQGPIVPTGEQALAYRCTSSGRPQDFSLSLPQGGTDPASLGRFASAVHQEALKALEESREFVASQRVTLERGTALAQEWQSAAISQSTAAVSRAMQALAAAGDSSHLAAEIEFDRSFQAARADPLNVPRVLVEGAAVARTENNLALALASKAYFEAAAAAADLEGATDLTPAGTANLASIGGPQGVLDFSRGNLAVPPSPLASPQFLAYAASPEGRGLRAIANQYAAAWAELGGSDQLDASENLMLTTGLALVHQAAASGRSGDWRMRDAQLYVANGALDVVRGFAGGLAGGLASAAALVPELAAGLNKAAVLLTASPQRQMEAAAAFFMAIPEIPGALRLAISASYAQFVNGTPEQQAEMIGRLASEVLIGLATGEAVTYLRGLAGVQVVRSAPARAALGRALSEVNAKEFGTFLAAGHLDDGAQAAAKLAGLLRDQPEAAVELARLAQIAVAEGSSGIGTFVEGWDLIDASAIRYAADELVSRSTPLDAAATRTWAGTLQTLRARAEAGGGLTGSSGERKVVRAIPRQTTDGRFLEAHQAWEPSPIAMSGRYKLRQEQAWSTSIINPALGKPAAWDIAIAEYGVDRAAENFWLVEKTVRPTKILVLDDATLGRLGLVRDQILQEGSVDAYLETHAISRLARELGFDAIEAPSAARIDGVLVNNGVLNLHILDPKLLR